MEIEQIDVIQPVIESIPKQEPKKESKEKDNKQPAKELVDANLQSIFSCATHPDNFLKLTKLTKTTNLTCKSCGFKIVGITGYLSCTNTKPCQILCSSCKVCKNNHFLSKVFSLKTYDASPLYSKNKFNCAACKTEKDITPEGVFHCGTCDYTLCMDCIRN